MRVAARAPSLRIRLLALVGVLAAGLLGLAGTAIWQAHDGAELRAGEQMLGTARALALLADQEFARAEALLQGLSGDPRIAEGDVAAFLAAAGRLDRALDGVVAALAEAPGRQLANTLAGAQASAEMPGGLDAVFATGRTTITNLYRGTMSGRPVVSIAVPVPAPEGGAPRFAVGMTLAPARFAALLATQHLPEGATASVVDRAGIIVANTRMPEAVGTAVTPGARAAMTAAPEGVFRNVPSRTGQMVLAAYARAPLSGYHIALAVPRAAFAAERNAALLRLAAYAAPVAGAALLVALLLGLRLRHALAGLPAGDTRPLLAEVEELAAALDASARAREASEAALRDRTAWLEQAQRAAQVGVWDLDLTSGVLRWSETTWALCGLDPRRDGPASVALFRGLVLEEDRWRIELARAEADRTDVYEVEFRIRRGDGVLRWLRAQGVMERAPDGAPRRLLGVNLDITERRALEEEREKLLAQKDLLVAEMHHRVKNSLQLVQGLLLLQARGAEPDLAARLKEAAGRIVSIAAVHRRLYEGDEGGLQDAADHLSGLADDLRRSIGSTGRQVEVEAEPGLPLPPDRMAALGLLATELVTNALKHGAGRIVLRLRRPAGDRAEAVLEVEDEGAGFPPGFEPNHSRGLGMRVAVAMARQLRGTLAAGPGPRVTVRFPAG